jgi:hypothetical protein
MLTTSPATRAERHARAARVLSSRSGTYPAQPTQTPASGLANVCKRYASHAGTLLLCIPASIPVAGLVYALFFNGTVT